MVTLYWSYIYWRDIETANQASLEFNDQDSLESIDQATGLAEYLGMPIATVSHLDGAKFTMMDGRLAAT